MERIKSHHIVRKKFEKELQSLPLKDRVKFLVSNHRRAIMLAKKHGLKVHTLKEEYYESKN